ncbi:MAG: lipopolysaccharide biosynthesis protein [Prevotellaceae bacterium]|jgi:O-antigen/teichoic acid export membrane protein|nr:lipopolysaccharide biosynthesis protein [Prevotellaceae bacterium]
MDNLKSKTTKGIFWSSIQTFSTQGIQFVIGIILARLLMPSDYGLIGMLGVFTAISGTFVNSGFSSALVRKQNCSEEDFSTVFYFNIIVAVFFYFVLFFTSPLIAAFYDVPALETITKVVALNLVINSFTIVQQAKLTKKIDFKTQMKASLLAVIISGIVGIIMAYNGFGVWALVVQILAGSFISTIMLWYYSKWRPKTGFSKKSFKELFGFGSKLLASGLLDTIYNNIYTIVIGKKFSQVELGYYTRASGLAQFPSSNITSILQRVTFPVLSTIQDDEDRLRVSYRKLLKLSAFIIFPLMVGLAALADPFIRFLLTDKWQDTIILLQIICFSMMWYPIHAINLNLLQVKGRSDLFLRLEIIKKIVGIIILVITIPLGLIAMCVGMIFSSVICLAINTYYTGKLINVGFFKQMKDLLPILIYSLTMGLLVFGITKMIHSNFISLITGVLLGITYYFCIAKLTKSPELIEIKNLLPNKFKKTE